MSASWCRSRTSVAAAAALLALALAGCPGDDAPPVECGVSGAPDEGITAAADGDQARFGDWVAGANNDCPGPGAPAGVVSLTVFGAQVEPAGAAFVTVCLPRPDLIREESYPLSRDVQPVPADDRVQLIDVQAAFGDGCRWDLDDTAEPDGTAAFTGLCEGGVDPAGFTMTLAATATVVETCPEAADRTLEVTLEGSVHVTPQ